MRLIALCLAALFPLAAFAGFDSALAAFQAKDYAKAMTEAREADAAGDVRASVLIGEMHRAGLGVTANATEAVTWYDKAARGGVIGAFAKMSQFYMRGDGVPKNTEKALAYARQSAKLGDPEGMLLVYVQLRANALNYFDASGKADAAKYDQLAKRPVSERALDQEAQDALYQAAAKGLPLAHLMLANVYGGTVGDNNNQRLLDTSAKIPGHNNKAVQGYESVIRYMAGLGSSLASPQLFVDAQKTQMLAAMLKTCSAQDAKELSKFPPPKLTAIAVATPLSNAVYLPSKVPGYERAYLIEGVWEEDWTYTSCDKSVSLRVRFNADGLGGARFASNHAGKDLPAIAKP